MTYFVGFWTKNVGMTTKDMLAVKHITMYYQVFGLTLLRSVYARRYKSKMVTFKYTTYSLDYNSKW